MVERYYDILNESDIQDNMFVVLEQFKKGTWILASYPIVFLTGIQLTNNYAHHKPLVASVSLVVDGVNQPSQPSTPSKVKR
jgi:hypothetical protein